MLREIQRIQKKDTVDEYNVLNSKHFGDLQSSIASLFYNSISTQTSVHFEICGLRVPYQRHQNFDNFFLRRFEITSKRKDCSGNPNLIRVCTSTCTSDNRKGGEVFWALTELFNFGGVTVCCAEIYELLCMIRYHRVRRRTHIHKVSERL
jgi:hypothetical protein